MGEALADAAIPAMPTDAGRDQVADAGQAEKRLVFRAEGDAEAGHFHEAARKQGRLRIVAEAEAVADASGDADDVLERPAQLDADDVEVGVDAKTIRAEVPLRPLRQFPVGAGNDDRRGQTAADFLGMAWPAEHG